MVMNFLRRALDLFVLACCCYVLGLYSKDIWFFMAGVTESDEVPERSTPSPQRTRNNIVNEKEKRREYAIRPPAFSRGARYDRNQEQNAADFDENADTRQAEADRNGPRYRGPIVLPKKIPPGPQISKSGDDEYGDIAARRMNVRNYNRNLKQDMPQNRPYHHEKNGPIYDSRDAENVERVGEMSPADGQPQQRVSNNADDEASVIMTRKSKNMKNYVPKLNQEANQNYENDDRNVVKREQYLFNQDRQNQQVQNQEIPENMINEERGSQRFVNVVLPRQLRSTNQERNYVEINEREQRNVKYDGNARQNMPGKKMNINNENVEYNIRIKNDGAYENNDKYGNTNDGGKVLSRNIRA